MCCYVVMRGYVLLCGVMCCDITMRDDVRLHCYV